MDPGGPTTPRRRRRRATYTCPCNVRRLLAGYDLPTDRLNGHVVARKGRTAFLAFACNLGSLHPMQVPTAIVLEDYSPHLSTATAPRVGNWAEANNAPDGTDDPGLAEPVRVTRRYIAWRNRHVTDPRLRKVIKRAAIIETPPPLFSRVLGQGQRDRLLATERAAEGTSRLNGSRVVE